MGLLPEEDVPTLIGTPGGRLSDAPSDGDGDGDDDTTTAEAGPPAAHLRTRPPPLPSSRPSRPSQPPETISSMPPPRTLTGPIASTVPVAAGFECELTDLDLEEDDGPEDSITTMAPRVSVSSITGLSIPASVEIRTIDGDDDELDETEVRTRPGIIALEIPVALRSPRPAAGVPAAAIGPDSEPEEDGVTTQAMAPRMPTAPELAALGLVSSAPSTDPQEPPSEVLTRPSIEPETRPGLPDPIEPETRPGLPDPETRPGHASLVEEDCPTARSLVPELYAEEGDSVTTQAPAFSDELMAAATAPPKTVHDGTLEDLTEGTTKKLRHPRKIAESLPADSEAESITTQAPAPLTNMLRVMAAGVTPENGIAVLEEDELPENRTAVMANAPLQRIVADRQASAGSSGSSTSSLPPIRPTAPGITIPHGSSAARAAAAPQRSSASESGLRVTRQPEHASVGVLGNADPRPSGISRSSPQPSPDLRPFAHPEVAFPAQPSVHAVDPGRGPRYGLVVALVAAVSFVVPVTLFVVLRGRSQEAVGGGTPSEAVIELQQREGTPRGKLDRKAAAAAAAASASASAAAAASASASASAAASAHNKPPHRR